MRFALAAVAALSMLVIRSDGRPPPSPMSLPWYPVPGGMFDIPSPNTFRLWVALWADGWGEVRGQLTRPGSPRLQSVYGDVLRRAEPWKFSFRPPAVYETEAIASLFIPNPPAVFYARYFVGPNRIQVDSVNTSMMNDDELTVLLSHELGHAIDAQTERVGHWSFRDVYWMNEQQFADHIARLLTTDAQVKAFNEKYIHPGAASR